MRGIGRTVATAIAIVCYLTACEFVSATPTPPLRQDQIPSVRTIFIRRGGFDHGQPWDYFRSTYELTRQADGFAGNASHVGIYSGRLQYPSNTIKLTEDVFVPSSAADEFLNLLARLTLAFGEEKLPPVEPAVTIRLELPSRTITYDVIGGGGYNTWRVFSSDFSYQVDKGDPLGALGIVSPYLDSTNPGQRMRDQIPSHMR